MNNPSSRTGLTLEEMRKKALKIVCQACVEQYGDTLEEGEENDLRDMPSLGDLDYGWVFIEEVVRAMSPLTLPILLKIWAKYHGEDRRTPEELADDEDLMRLFERAKARREAMALGLGFQAP